MGCGDVEGPALQAGERPLSAFISSVMRPEIQWARDAAVEALSGNNLFAPWAFEYTPASSDGAIATYLNKVREADVVIWLVGEETTTPVRNEIAEALAAGCRLWVVRLPASERTEETRRLLAEVGDRVKWGDAADADALRELLGLTFGDEIVRAMRQAPGLTRLARLEDLGRASRARMISRWQAPGLEVGEAIRLADDLSIGVPPAEILPSAEAPLRIVVADVGAGKSVVAERALQQAIIAARERALAPVPIFLHARECRPTLEAAVRARGEGFGDPSVDGAFVVIDGLDEIAHGSAADLVNAARALVLALPETRVLMTSRPLALLARARERIDLPPLSDEETRELINRVADRSSSGFGVHWPRALEKEIHRPLFAILFALDWRERDGRGSSTGSLLAGLVERAVDRDRASAAMPQLQRLARLMTDRSGVPVATSEAGDFRDRLAVSESRLVAEDGDLLSFTLPIFAQWFAAESLKAGEPIVAELVLDPVRLDRWRYAAAIALATGSEAFVAEFMTAIARTDPAFAADVLQESLVKWASDQVQVRPDSMAAGRKLREAFVAWGEGIGPLDQLLLPRSASGELLPLAVEAEGGWLLTGWHDGSEDPSEVVRFKGKVHLFGDQVPGWDVRRGGQWNADKGWEWHWSLEQLTRDLEGHVKTPALRVSNRLLIDEAVWLLALKAHGNRSFSDIPLDLAPVQEQLRRVAKGGVIRLSDRYAYVDEVLQRADELVGTKGPEMAPPYPSGDVDVVGGWIWDPYSEERQLERAISVYTAAISIYQSLVARWFPALAARLQTAVFLPARFVGELQPTRGGSWGEGPVLAWHWEPLPAGSESVVDIKLEVSSHPARSYAEVLRDYEGDHQRLQDLRPEAAEWISTTYSFGRADFFGAAPAVPIAYEWLVKDLKRVNWLP